jgi:subfamily B ATP-binding cassette protein MsbA
MRDLRRLLRFLRPHRGSLLIAALCLVGVSLATVALAALLRPLFDQVLASGEGAAEGAGDLAGAAAPLGAAGRAAADAAIWGLPLALVALYLSKGVMAFGAVYLLSRTAHQVVGRIRQEGFAALQRQGADLLERHPSGGLVSRLTADAEALHSMLSEHLASLCRDSLVVAGLLAWIFYLDARLALVSLAVAPAVVWPTRAIGRRLRRVAHASRERLGALAARAQESIAGARVVRAFGLQRRLEADFARENDWLTGERTEAARWLALASPLMELLGGVAAALVFVAGADALRDGRMSGGALLSFLTALFLQYTPIKRLSHVHSQVQQGLAASCRLFEIIDSPGEESLWRGARPLRRARGGIELRRVTVRRGGRAILQGASLRLEPGERVALVGASGAGKTTLLSLLLGFVTPDAGEVVLDGVNARELRLADLRRQISLVSQETVLFAGSLEENVRCARPDASEAEVAEALRSAQLGDLVEALPEGARTRLSEGGLPLSAGERQRLAIARALLKDAPIVLLDEATSALDPGTERRLHAALERLIEGRTALIVTHRRAGLRLAGRCVRLRGGRIEAEPPAAALAGLDGVGTEERGAGAGWARA